MQNHLLLDLLQMAQMPQMGEASQTFTLSGDVDDA